MNREISKYLAQIGAKGGKAGKGKPKTGRTHESFAQAGRLGAMKRWAGRQAPPPASANVRPL